LIRVRFRRRVFRFYKVDRAQTVLRSLFLQGARTNKKDYDGSIADWDKAIALVPTAEAYNNRSQNHVFKGSYDAAIVDATKAIEINPKLVEPHFNRGRSYLFKKNYADALADANKAIEFNPQSADAYKFRAEVFDKTGEKAKAADRRKAEDLKKSP
jgi:tetratricopeptide (TPR) repeat protein